MKKNRKKTKDMHMSLPRTSASELMGKQSVRATFRLSTEAISILSKISLHMGILQKTLLDHLAEDEKTLQIMAGEIPQHDPERKKRIPKTFVLSRKTLRVLDEISEEQSRPRDLLVEYLIMRLRPLVSGEREKHGKRTGLVQETGELLESVEKILEKSAASLGKDDPLYIQLEKMVLAFRNAHRQIAVFVKKGETAEKGS
ncbi:MAG: hypothetical protein AB7S75_25350 [Desulfococcaceae bacterium]